MKKIIKQLIPNRIIFLVKETKYNVKDFVDLFLGRRDSLTPPKRKIFVGAGDYNIIGNEFLQYFIEFGGLKSNEKILDVGCGIGRMAVPLTKYLNSDGKYEGIDIVKDGISWCNKKISPKFSNFQFQLANIYNERYNPNGKYQASEYKFPFNNNTFDFVFLTSVFTHMLPNDLENYLSEISRVLKKGGRCFITYFLFNKESLYLIEKGKSRIDFKYRYEKYRVINEDIPEDVIGFNEEYIKTLYNRFDLKITCPIKYGSWCGRSDFVSYQDIIVASKL